SRTWLLVVLILGVSACEGARSGHASSNVRQSPAVSAATSADPERCARLARRGFAPCPPTPDKMQLPPTTIRNATNGAISDATAQQWGRAFQLTEAYYRWAMQDNARAALTSGALAEPAAATNLFGPDLKSLDDAKKLGGQLIDNEGSMPEVKLVSVPTSLQNRMTQQALVAKPFAVVALFSGTTSRSVRLPDGREIALGTTSSDVQLLIWGEFKSDPDLGAIWYEHGLYGCQYPEVSSVCQPR